MEKNSSEGPSPRRISCVSYLNSVPFIFGLRNSGFLEKNNTELSLDIPSVCAIRMLSGTADAGLLPSAVLPSVPGGRIISPYGICAEGPVTSVMLYSLSPMDKIRSVILDYQSRTSAQLVRILARDLWKISPEWKESKPGFENNRNEGEALLIIGDRALERQGSFPYQWDLSEEWHRLTGLPFVFALWVSGKELPADWVRGFNDALGYGLDRLNSLTEHYSTSSLSPARIRDYLENHIQYRLTDRHKQGLDTFLELAGKLIPEL